MWESILSQPVDKKKSHLPSPPPPQMPQGHTNKIYYLKDEKIDIVDELIGFINTHNQVGRYNTTLLDQETIDRLHRSYACLSVIFDKGTIIGTMLSLGFRTSLVLVDEPVTTSYTTLLCVHRDYRELGIAMLLIQSIMAFGGDYDIYSGYYLSEKIHQPTRKSVKGWYRPIDYQYIRKAGYALAPVKRSSQYKLMYHIPKPNEPLQLTTDYESVIKFMSNMGHFRPMPEQLRVFDVYMNSKGVALLIPMRVKVSKTKIIVNVIYVAYVTGNILGEILDVSRGYHLLSGFHMGPMSMEVVHSLHGHTTTAISQLEFFNLPEGDYYLPVF